MRTPKFGTLIFGNSQKGSAAGLCCKAHAQQRSHAATGEILWERTRWSLAGKIRPRFRAKLREINARQGHSEARNNNRERGSGPCLG